MAAPMEEWYDYTRFFIALVAIVDPFAAVPVFLSATTNLTQERKIRTIRYTILTVFSVLAVSAFSGDMILTLVGTSLDAFRVGGGLILLTMAFNMLEQTVTLEVTKSSTPFTESIGVAPLGVPLLAGPGAISATIIQMQRGSGWMHSLLIVACILMACLFLWFTLRMSETLGNILGERGLTILNKLFGLLLAAIAVQIMANGLLGLFPGLSGLPVTH